MNQKCGTEILKEGISLSSQICSLVNFVVISVAQNVTSLTDHTKHSKIFNFQYQKLEIKLTLKHA